MPLQLPKMPYKAKEEDFADLSETGISIAEAIGERDSQEDTISVGKVSKQKLAAQNPAHFFKEEMPKIISDHSECRNGTTNCSVIVTPPEEGEKFPKITVDPLRNDFINSPNFKLSTNFCYPAQSFGFAV